MSAGQFELKSATLAEKPSTVSQIGIRAAVGAVQLE